jgi:DNA topoisomerase-1
LLTQARDNNTVLRVLGNHPDDQASVEICSGRYGPYARHGKINATLPKGTSPDDITLEEALELIAARAAKGPAAKKPSSRAKAAPKKAAATTKTASTKTKKTAATTKKTTKTAVKKPAAKKTTRTKT